MNIIAIDCGASFLKAALFIGDKLKEDRQIAVSRDSKSSNLFDCTSINSLIYLVKELISGLSYGLDNVYICISNEMHGFILADKNGSAIIDYISWQKEYGLIEIDRKSSKSILEQKDYLEEVYKSGMPVRAGLPSSNLLYLKRVGILSNYKEDLFFYTLGDYIIRVISGEQPICHVTNAAATGLYDLLQSQWNDKLLNCVSNDNIIFPKVGEDVIVKNVNNCNMLFLPAIGDQQAALLGAGLNNIGDISFNLGTGGQVSMLVTDVELSNNWQIRPFFKGMYIKSIPHLPSGRAINVYIRFIKNILQSFDKKYDDSTIWNTILNIDYNKCESMVESDLSFFENPVTNFTMGSIKNISEYGLSLDTLFKSIFMQIAKNCLKATLILEEDKLLINRILFSGGVAKKIEVIRTIIMKEFPNAKCIIAPDKETLYGLYQYCIVNEKDSHHE